jgi:hypothetical protein
MTVIVTTAVATPSQRAAARLLIESLRTFGGPLSDSPVWLFDHNPDAYRDQPVDGVHIRRLEISAALDQVWFAGKVTACAHAEADAVPGDTLVWLSTDCLIVQPPLLLDLAATSFDAAVRPVHHRNVGLPASAPLDAFWSGVYNAVGMDDLAMTVKTFVEGECLRAYVNTHALALNPARGLCCQWLEIFAQLANDEAFQARACQDVPHRIFLHQAVLSALLATKLPSESIRILPHTYSYPYNLHHEVPPERRAAALNDLVSVAYEDRSLHPDDLQDLIVRDPLRRWLAAKTAPRADQDA